MPSPSPHFNAPINALRWQKGMANNRTLAKTISTLFSTVLTPWARQATFSSTLFSKNTSNLLAAPPLGHVWGTPLYMLEALGLRLLKFSLAQCYIALPQLTLLTINLLRSSLFNLRRMWYFCLFPWHPNFFARQFGFRQGLPSPPLFSRNKDPYEVREKFRWPPPYFWSSV